MSTGGGACKNACNNSPTSAARFSPHSGQPVRDRRRRAKRLRSLHGPIELKVWPLAQRTNLIAMDVVEVAPAYDVSDNTVNNAHRVVFEALGGLAWKRREAAHASVPPGE